MTRTLMIRGGAVGDFVQTLPLLEAVRQSDDEAEIHVLGYPAIAEMAVGRRHATEAHRVDGAEWAPLFAPGSRLAAAQEELLKSFDRVLCVWPDEDGRIRESLHQAGCRHVIYVNPVPSPGGSVHVIDYMLQQGERAGLTAARPVPQLFPNDRDRTWAERFMRITYAGARTLLGMHPGSGSAKKNWPAERFAEVARMWIEQMDGHVLLSAGPADREALSVFDSALQSDRVFVLEEERLPHLAACLERCQVFLGNDSGITHMAAAVHTPVVALFGPTDPTVWGPRGKRIETLRSESSEEMQAITPGRVTQALTRLARWV